eukprot:TRINITY_DN25624_c0_g1_i3.p1 TRINITY_DN25624_c0_g1~~TRINITY_DN25624_c0_g1_i3.p1  ORF type:complete len:138 (-),score=10.20 TRINITY_DN25624_c0_g1_i3:521-934(-)
MRNALLRAKVCREPKPPAVTVILADLNQPRQQDYEAWQWDIIVAGRRGLGEPDDDGVAALLSKKGFECTFDAQHGCTTNFGPRRAPAFTHWTGTTVDYAYVRRGSPEQARIVGSYVYYSPLSDHLPLVTDIRMSRAS